MKKTIWLILIIVLGLITLRSALGTKDVFVYYVRDARINGSLINGLGTVNFSLFDALTGGSEVFNQPNLTNVNFSSGITNLTITSDKSSLDFSNEYWVQIMFNDTIYDRMQIASMPHSQNANDSLLLGGKTESQLNTNQSGKWDLLDVPDDITVGGNVSGNLSNLQITALNLNTIIFAGSLGIENITACAENQILQVSSGVWSCASSGSYDLNITTDSGSETITDSEILRVLGGTGINTSISGNNITINNELIDADTTYSNGTGITLVGTLFNHSDTSSQASSDNSGRTYIQDIILDSMGHTTSVVTATETVSDTDTQWSLNLTDLYNNSGVLSHNYTTLDANFVGQTEYPNLDTDSTDDVANSTAGTFNMTVNNVSCTDCIIDSEVSDTLTSSDLQAGSSVVADSEVDNDLTLTGGSLALDTTSYSGSLGAGNLTEDVLLETELDTIAELNTQIADATIVYNNSARYNIDINSSEVCIESSCISDWANVNQSAQDTNESTRFEALAGTSCVSGDFIFNFSSDGTPQCDTPAGSGDITAVNTDDLYIYNGSTSGAVGLKFNDTRLNITINDKGFFSDVSNFTSTLTNDRWCAYDGTNINCTVPPVTDTDTTYSNGTGITLVGTLFNHSDTSSQASSDNSGRVYIQDLILDAFGHITSIVTATETFVNSLWDLNTTVFLNESGKLGINRTFFDTYLDNTDSNVTSIDVTNVNEVYTLHVEQASGNITTAWSDFFGSKIDDTEMRAEDFGDWTCDSTEDGCSLNAGVVQDNEIDYSAVTLNDFPNDVGFFDDVSNFTSTLTNDRWCAYDGTNINCTVPPVTDTDTTYSNGTGITLVGTLFNHSDTSSVSNVDNSGNTFIQDVTFDEFGHVASTTSASASSGGNSTQEIRDAINNSGIYNLQGLNVSLNITQPDNQKHCFGNDNDFCIYWNGTAGIIE